MATVTFQMKDKDLAGLIRSLFDLGDEARVQVMVHFRRRPKQIDRPMELVWNVELMPNDGGIYHTLLEGGQGEKDIHPNQN